MNRPSLSPWIASSFVASSLFLLAGSALAGGPGNVCPGTDRILGWQKITANYGDVGCGTYAPSVFAPGGAYLGNNAVTASRQSGAVESMFSCLPYYPDDGWVYENDGTWALGTDSLWGDGLSEIFVGKNAYTAWFLIEVDGGGIVEPGDSHIANSTTATSFTLDASDNVYAVGMNGACGHSGYPAGSCIQETKNKGTTWTNLPENPGAVQITSDLAAGNLYAVGENKNVWYSAFGSSSWTELPGVAADMVAATDDTVYAIGDNGGKPGDVYVYLSEAYGYGADYWWDITAAGYGPQMTTIAASYGVGGTGPVTATDGNGNVYTLGCTSNE